MQVIESLKNYFLLTTVSSYLPNCRVPTLKEERSCDQGLKKLINDGQLTGQ